MAAEDPSLFRQHAAVILARQAALRELKQQRKRLGLRETLPMSTLTKMAMDWVEQHPELIAEAAASPIVQNLQHPHRRRRPDSKRELLCESQGEALVDIARTFNVSHSTISRVTLAPT
jgi:hypothetical protein